MQLSRLEQETIIVFNENEKTAIIETFNKSLQKRLDGFCEEFPDLFKYIEGKWNTDGFKRYEIPKTSVLIKKPTVLSEEEKIRRSKRAKKMFN